MKLAQATNRLRAMIQSLWGASNISDIHKVTEEQAAQPAQALQKFECRNRAFGNTCGSTWESPRFSPCPNCGQRRFVHKVGEDEEAV